MERKESQTNERLDGVGGWVVKHDSDDAVASAALSLTRSPACAAENDHQLAWATQSASDRDVTFPQARSGQVTVQRRSRSAPLRAEDVT